jgi:hypothetical protein
MAEVATSNGDVAGKKEKVELIKPEKPDEEAYKANLKKAEKDHADVMTKIVCTEKSHECFVTSPHMYGSGACRIFLTSILYRTPSRLSLISQSPTRRTPQPTAAVPTSSPRSRAFARSKELERLVATSYSMRSSLKMLSSRTLLPSKRLPAAAYLSRALRIWTVRLNAWTSKLAPV